MHNKGIAAALILLTALSITACGHNSSNTATSQTAASAVSTEEIDSGWEKATSPELTDEVKAAPITVSFAGTVRMHMFSYIFMRIWTKMHRSQAV